MILLSKRGGEFIFVNGLAGNWMREDRRRWRDVVLLGEIEPKLARKLNKEAMRGGYVTVQLCRKMVCYVARGKFMSCDSFGLRNRKRPVSMRIEIFFGSRNWEVLR